MGYKRDTMKFCSNMPLLASPVSCRCAPLHKALEALSFVPQDRNYTIYRTCSHLNIPPPTVTCSFCFHALNAIHLCLKCSLTSSERFMFPCHYNAMLILNMAPTVADENEWPHLSVSISPSISGDWRWGEELLVATVRFNGGRFLTPLALVTL